MRARLELSAMAGAALTMLGSGAAAQVTFMSADGSYALDGGATNLLNSSYPPNSNVDVLSFPSSLTSGAGLHSYGSVSGNFGSRSSGSGVYLVNGGFQIVESFTNSSATAQQGTFHFQITPGILQNTLGTTLSTGQYLSAGINFQVQRDGNPVWTSAASLITHPDGVHYSTSGDTSLYAGGGSMYNVLGVPRDVDLGVINAGETIQLSYTMTSFANGNAPAGDPVLVPEQTFVVPDGWYLVGGCGGYGQPAALAYGYGGCTHYNPGDIITIPEHYTSGAPGSSQASSGDPFHIELNGVDYTVNTFSQNQLGDVTLSPVPEPGQYAMMLSGLGILAWLARRRRQDS